MVDVAASTEKEQEWDGMSGWYEKVIEPATIQGTVTCAVMTEMRAAKRTIEVACGPGKHSRLLASNFLRDDGGVLVSCDISGKMVQKIKANYEGEDCEYKLVPGNKFVVDTETNYAEFKDPNSLKATVDLSKMLDSHQPFRKFVFACQATNELLPFESQFFDSYLANLSLLHVNSRPNMLNEAFRVLRPGGTACFTTWGRKEKCVFFTTVDTVLGRHFPPETLKLFDKSHFFKLYENKDQTLQEMEAAGFTDIKVWEQSQNVLMNGGEDFMTRTGDNVLKAFARMNGIEVDKVMAIRPEIVQFFDAQNKASLNTFELAVFVAFKPPVAKV